MQMNLLYTLLAINTITLIVHIRFFIYFYIKSKKKKRNYARESNESETRNKQFENYLNEIMGLGCADAITAYMLRNGKVFLNKEAEFKLIMTHEKLGDYYEFKSVIRTHQPQHITAYGLTYTELKNKKVLEIYADDSISKEYFQSNYCMIAELKERGTHFAVLFYLQSPKDNTPFGIICLEYRKGEHEWKKEKKSRNLYLSAAYNIQKIIEKCCFLLETSR
jgi:hypothetical protein